MSSEELRIAAQENQVVQVSAMVLLELLNKANHVATTPDDKLGGDQKSRLSLLVQNTLEKTQRGATKS